MKQKQWLLITIIMIIAAGLRLWLISDIPPGITHDEADHGLSAWGVLNHIRPIYFTVGYGREPLYDYATAGLMAVIGSHYLAGRLTAAFFGMLLLAATYTWTKIAYNKQIALFTMAGLAVSFWGVMVSRHALRTITMPTLFTIATLIYWQAMQAKKNLPKQKIIVAGIIVGATFYTYLPARILWLLFPALLLWWVCTDREQFWCQWKPICMMLIISACIAFPLFYHLQTTGGMERIDQLSGSLDALWMGEWRPLWNNVIGALRLFTIAGDDGVIMWRYNIPGRPLLSPIMGILFYIGLIISLWKLVKQQHTATAFAIMWLIAGLSPALITGPEGSTTRAAAMMPVLYLFPALTIDAFWKKWGDRSPVFYLAGILLFTMTLVETTYSYFVTWANEPQVRVQYETTRITALEWMNDHGGTAAMSSPNPNRFHDPAMEVVTITNRDEPIRWFNGAHSLVLPNDHESTLIFSAWADEQILTQFVEITPTYKLPLKETDLDSPITIYTVDTQQITADLLLNTFTPTPPITIGEYAQLHGYHIEKLAAEWQLSTLWEVIQPTDQPLTFFTNLFDPITQQVPYSVSRLDVPSYYWQAGDHFIQTHNIPLPAVSADNSTINYPIYVGAFIQSAQGDVIPIRNNLNKNEYQLTTYRPDDQ